MKSAFAISRQTRANTVNLLNSLTLEELNTIPKGFNNNILWNAGHIALVQTLLTYGLSGNEVNIPVGWKDKFGKGSIPSTYTQDDLDAVIKALNEGTNQLEIDYEMGIFKEYKTYETSYGFTLISIEEAIEFVNTHDALHLGYMMAQRKALTATT